MPRVLTSRAASYGSGGYAAFSGGDPNMLTAEVISVDNEQANDFTRSITLENGARVTIHYRRGGETLTGKMAAVLAEHMAKGKGAVNDLCANRQDG